LYILAAEPVSDLRPHAADHRDLAAAALVLVAMILLLLRWMRLDRGALVGTGWLGDVLRQVHAAARRRLFVEGGVGAALTAILLSLIPLAHLSLTNEPPRPRPAAGKAEALTAGESAATPQPPEDGNPPHDLADVVAAPGNRTVWAPNRLLFLLGTFLFLWLIWTYLAPLGTGRHHWLRTLASLHRYQTVNEPPPAAVRHTCAALAYCTRRAVLRDTAQFSRQSSVVGLWQNELLLSLNRTQRDAVGTEDTFRHLRRLVQAIERACDQHTPLLDPARVRRAFGGSRWGLVAVALALPLCVALAAVCCHVVEHVLGGAVPF
jgi:hypothetical protein